MLATRAAAYHPNGRPGPGHNARVDIPGIERARVAQVSPAGGVLVTLDRFHRNRPAPVVMSLSAPTVAVGDHVVVACLGGSLDDLLLLDVLT